MPDKEAVIRSLINCMSDEEECSDKCQYFFMPIPNGCLFSLMQDAVQLLKNSELVVRCKDCKHGKPSACGYGIDCDGRWYDDNGFCSDGERKEG